MISAFAPQRQRRVPRTRKRPSSDVPAVDPNKGLKMPWLHSQKAKVQKGIFEKAGHLGGGTSTSRSFLMPIHAWLRGFQLRPCLFNTLLQARRLHDLLPHAAVSLLSQLSAQPLAPIAPEGTGRVRLCSGSHCKLCFWPGSEIAHVSAQHHALST